MNLEMFLLLLLIVSVFTGLFTQAFKAIMTEMNKTYYANTAAGVISVALSAGVGASYLVLTETVFNQKMAVILLALVLLSWLSAMVGYDKVIQAITQVRTGKKE